MQFQARRREALGLEKHMQFQAGMWAEESIGSGEVPIHLGHVYLCFCF
jgi:hypothetical protein